MTLALCLLNGLGTGISVMDGSSLVQACHLSARGESTSLSQDFSGNCGRWCE